MTSFSILLFAWQTRNKDVVFQKYDSHTKGLDVEIRKAIKRWKDETFAENVPRKGSLTKERN